VNEQLKPLAQRIGEIFAPFGRSDAPGLVLGVTRGNNTVFRQGFGLASIEHGLANGPTTRMRIGSTSKQFTCLATLLLAEDGMLDVDASVRAYLPELPTLEGEPTLRQLMTHTGDIAAISTSGSSRMARRLSRLAKSSRSKVVKPA
jgi:CubicO group peptidase (beta-lactamase class C family)